MKSNVCVSFTDRKVLFMKSAHEDVQCRDNVVLVPHDKVYITVNAMQIDTGRDDDYAVITSFNKPINSSTSDIYMIKTYCDNNIRLFTPVATFNFALEVPSTLTVSNDYSSPLLYCTVTSIKHKNCHETSNIEDNN